MLLLGAALCLLPIQRAVCRTAWSTKVSLQDGGDGSWKPPSRHVLMYTQGRKTQKPSTPAVLQLPQKVWGFTFWESGFSSGFVDILQAALSRDVGPSPIASAADTHEPRAGIRTLVSLPCYLQLPESQQTWESWLPTKIEALRFT